MQEFGPHLGRIKFHRLLLYKHTLLRSSFLPPHPHPKMTTNHYTPLQMLIPFLYVAIPSPGGFTSLLSAYLGGYNPSLRFHLIMIEACG